MHTIVSPIQWEHMILTGTTAEVRYTMAEARTMLLLLLLVLTLHMQLVCNPINLPGSRRFCIKFFHELKLESCTE